MPVYKDKSHEELRWEDCQPGDKGGPLPAAQVAAGIGFASSPTSSSLFGHSPTFGQSSFGVSDALVFGSSTAFGASSNPIFGSSTTSAFGASSTPTFGGSSPSFGSPNTLSFIFGSSPAFIQSTSAFGFGSSHASSSLLGPSPTFGQSSSGPFSTSIPSNPFAPKTPSVGGLSFGTSTAPTFSSSPFGASILSGLFGSTSLPTSSTFGVGSSLSIFGSSSPRFSCSPSPSISWFFLVRSI